MGRSHISGLSSRDGFDADYIVKIDSNYFPIVYAEPAEKVITKNPIGLNFKPMLIKNNVQVDQDKIWVTPMSLANKHINYFIIAPVFSHVRPDLTDFIILSVSPSKFIKSLQLQPGFRLTLKVLNIVGDDTLDYESVLGHEVSKSRAQYIDFKVGDWVNDIPITFGSQSFILRMEHDYTIQSHELILLFVAAIFVLIINTLFWLLVKARYSVWRPIYLIREKVNSLRL